MPSLPRRPIALADQPPARHRVLDARRARRTWLLQKRTSPESERTTHAGTRRSRRRWTSRRRRCCSSRRTSSRSSPRCLAAEDLGALSRSCRKHCYGDGRRSLAQLKKTLKRRALRRVHADHRPRRTHHFCLYADGSNRALWEQSTAKLPDREDDLSRYALQTLGDRARPMQPDELRRDARSPISSELTTRPVCRRRICVCLMALMSPIRAARPTSRA